VVAGARFKGNRIDARRTRCRFQPQYQRAADAVATIRGIHREEHDMRRVVAIFHDRESGNVSQ